MNKILIFLLVVFCSCNNTKELNSKAKPVAEKGNEYFSWLSTLKLPESLDFCGEKVPLDIPEVRERAEREFFINLQSPGQIILLMKRAGRYFPLFEKIIKEQNMPVDLKYIAVAESGLYMSRSPKDAVGLWQFIPETGKKMGLQIDDFVDERRHPEKSTEAAMKYLLNGYEYHKSWTLAAAGYNMGHGNVDDNLQFQTTDNFYDLYLNEETSRYILRIVILKEIMKNPNKYGIILKPDDLYQPEKVEYVKCDYFIPNLAAWAKEHGTTYKDVKLLNPWILQRKLPSPPKGKIYDIAILKK